MVVVVGEVVKTVVEVGLSSLLIEGCYLFWLKEYRRLDRMFCGTWETGKLDGLYTSSGNVAGHQIWRELCHRTSRCDVDRIMSKCILTFLQQTDGGLRYNLSLVRSTFHMTLGSEKVCRVMQKRVMQEQCSVYFEIISRDHYSQTIQIHARVTHFEVCHYQLMITMKWMV